MNLEKRLAARGAVALAALVGLSTVAGMRVLKSSSQGVPETFVATRRTFPIVLAEAGVLRAQQYVVYRSPFAGRETEVTFLAPEGLHVRAGDLVARVDTTEAEAELQRAMQALRQAQLDAELSTGQVEEARGAVASLVDGEGALAPEESKVAVEQAERRVTRLEKEQSALSSLLRNGYITREELDRVEADLAEAQGQLRLAQAKARVIIERTQPRQQREATFQLAQRVSQASYARLRLDEAESRVAALQAAITAASQYARSEGIVIYGDYLGASPRRKVRVGDRVTGSQDLVSIPSIDSLRMETSVRESELARVRAGQQVEVVLEAFPDRRLEGVVGAIGALVQSTADPLNDERRFVVQVDLKTPFEAARPDMAARARIITDVRRDVVAVPITAVVFRDDAAWVWQRTWHGPTAQRVEVGAVTTDWAEIKRGLAEGSDVFVRPPAGSTDDR